MRDEEIIDYWLCDDCATAKGGKFPNGHVCTVTHGTCKYCSKDNVMLIPWVDFEWPLRKTKHMRD